MSHYETLGVAKTATLDEIKKAYRKLASQHHPDKGGDTAKFQQIEEAYRILSDPNQRQQYDSPQRHQQFHWNNFDNEPDVEDLFRNFGFHFNGGHSPFGFNQRQPRRNKDLRVDIQLFLDSTLNEQTKTVSVQTSNGNRETVEVTIPRGITNGSQIKYTGLGDNFFNTLPRGDLYVHFHIIPNTGYTVNGLDVHTTIEIDCLSAIVGGETEVAGIDNSRFMVVIPPGTQPGMMLRIKEQGLWQLNGSTRGNLIVKISITVPKNLTEEQLSMIRQIQQTL